MNAIKALSNGPVTTITTSVSITNKIFIGYDEHIKGSYVQVNINDNPLMLKVEDFNDPSGQVFKTIAKQGGENIKYKKIQLKEAVQALVRLVQDDYDNYAELLEDTDSHFGYAYAKHGWNMTPEGLRYFNQGFSHSNRHYVGPTGPQLDMVQHGDKDAYLESFRKVFLNNTNVRKHLGFAAAGFIRGLIPGIDSNPIWVIETCAGTGQTVLAKWVESMMFRPNEYGTSNCTVALAMEWMNGCSHRPLVLDEEGTALRHAAESTRDMYIYNLASGQFRVRTTTTNPESFSIKTTVLLMDQSIGTLGAGAEARVKRFKYDYEKNKLWNQFAIPSQDNYGWLAPMLIEDVQKNLVAYQDFFKRIRPLVSTDGEALAVLGEQMLAKVLGLKL